MCISDPNISSWPVRIFLYRSKRVLFYWENKNKQIKSDPTYHFYKNVTRKDALRGLKNKYALCKVRRGLTFNHALNVNTYLLKMFSYTNICYRCVFYCAFFYFVTNGQLWGFFNKKGSYCFIVVFNSYTQFATWTTTAVFTTLILRVAGSCQNL